MLDACAVGVSALEMCIFLIKYSDDKVKKRPVKPVYLYIAPNQPKYLISQYLGFTYSTNITCSCPSTYIPKQHTKPKNVWETH